MAASDSRITKLELDIGNTSQDQLKQNMTVMASLLVDTVYDHLIYKIQENSTSREYRGQVHQFLNEAVANFIQGKTGQP